MNKNELIKKITTKKELSQLPEKDVELAFSHFEKRSVSDDEKIRLTRELLHKVFGAFGNRKLFSSQKKDFEWILKKHLSTRERFPFYKEVYKRIFEGLNKELNVFDLGAGVNGFSYPFFKEVKRGVNYFAFESIGQFVYLMNFYFLENKINGRAFHLSLFEKEKIKEIIKNVKNKKPKIVFLFKVVDSLELLKKNYSKELLLELGKISNRIALSFQTRSMIKRKKFKTQRFWLINFIKNHFNILDDFEFGGERYILISMKNL